jgi:hypothetical protein
MLLVLKSEENGKLYGLAIFQYIAGIQIYYLYYVHNIGILYIDGVCEVGIHRNQNGNPLLQETWQCRCTNTNDTCGEIKSGNLTTCMVNA